MMFFLLSGHKNKNPAHTEWYEQDFSLGAERGQFSTFISGYPAPAIVRAE